MKKIYLLLLFCINISVAQVSDFGDIDFTVADNIAKLNKGASLDNVALLTQKLTRKLDTDVQKFRAIHSWICQNVTGDYTQHTKVLRKRRRLKNDDTSLQNWNNAYLKKAYKKLRRYKRTMCTGYAYLLKEMCFLAGIEAKIVDGYARTVDANIEELDFQNHSWNAVKLNDKWYLCDATWSSGYMDENSIFVSDYNDGYFLASPLLFNQNHYPIDKKWLLIEDQIKSDYIAGPIVYGEAFTHNATPLFPKEMHVKTDKGTAVKFSLKLDDASNHKISLLHTARRRDSKLVLSNLTSKDGIITFDHQFKRKGFYDVHVMVDEDIIATYTVKVSK